MPVAKLSYDTEHTYRTSLPGSDYCNTAISSALNDVFRGLGIPRPDFGIDYQSLKFRRDDDVLVASVVKHNIDQIEYDSVTDRTLAIETLINRSMLMAGIPGVIAETIKFEIEDE